MTLISYKIPNVSKNFCLVYYFFFFCNKETFVHLILNVTPNWSIRIIICLSNVMRSLKQKNQNCQIIIITSYVTLYKKIMCIFLIVCLYMYCRWTSNYQEGELGIPFSGLTPPPFSAYSNPRARFPTSYGVAFLIFNGLMWDIHAFCSFCWYWWNSWPSLFKLSLDNESRRCLTVSTLGTVLFCVD